MIQWLFLRCRSWKCTDSTGRRTCQVAIAQPKHCKEPRRAECVLEKPQMSSGTTQSPSSPAETALLPPELRPYKAKLRPNFLSSNLMCAACSLSSLASYWLSIGSVMERTPLPERTHLVPILNWITNTHPVIKLLWVLLWEDRGGKTWGQERRYLGSPEKLVTSFIPSSPFTAIYLRATSSERVKNKVLPPQHVFWSSQEGSSWFVRGPQAACLQLCLPMNKSDSNYSWWRGLQGTKPTICLTSLDLFMLC